MGALARFANWLAGRARADFGVDGGGPRTISDYEAPYRASSLSSQELAAFRPPLRSGDFANAMRRDLTLARVQDIVRNDPHASSALDKLVDHVVGRGLRWSAQPDADVLKLDPIAQREYAKSLEAEWRHFATDPRRFVDAATRLSFNGLMRLLARTFLMGNEAAYLITLHDDPAARYRTCVLPIDPDRIGNPYGEMDTLTRRLGVEQTPLGRPLGYWVRAAHLGDYWAPGEQMRWDYAPRKTDWGRPLFVHGFEPMREGDTRGTSPFLVLIASMRALGRFTDAELASAAINATFAATIESDAPADEVADRLKPAAEVKAGPRTMFGWQIEHLERYPARVNGSRVPVLPPGSSLKMNSSPRQTTSFNAFETAFLQTISSRLGLAYEQIKMDWSRTNYSSARAALNEVWRGMDRRSAQFQEQIVAPLHLAWADEAFDRGYLSPPPGAPAFWDAPHAYLRGRWIGPPRGYVDPVKEMQAAALRMEGLTSTLRDECAEQGKDWEEVLDQIAFEEKALTERGLTRESLVAVVQSTKGPKPDSEEAVGPAGPGGEDKEGSR
jgi:lambda family phage portal protein